MSNERAAAVRTRLQDDARVETLEWFKTIGSTNDYLRAAEPPRAARLRVAIADEQTHGRGRGQNRWTSRHGAGLWMSLAYTFAPIPPALNTLTLVLGVGIARCLHTCGVSAVMLKWPNDLMFDDRKLGGILVETQSQGVTATAVCGIGINWVAPAADEFSPADRAMRPVGLSSAVADVPPLEALAASVTDAASDTFRRFEAHGLGAFLHDWDRLDWLRGRCVALDSPRVEGIAMGIDADGRLRVKLDDRMITVTSSTVRVIGLS